MSNKIIMGKLDFNKSRVQDQKTHVINETIPFIWHLNHKIEVFTFFH